MESLTISVPVDTQTAAAYRAASAETKKKIELLLSLRLRDTIGRPQRALQTIMDDAGRQAAANGLTPDLLTQILQYDD